MLNHMNFHFPKVHNAWRYFRILKSYLPLYLIFFKDLSIDIKEISNSRLGIMIVLIILKKKTIKSNSEVIL